MLTQVGLLLKVYGAIRESRVPALEKRLSPPARTSGASAVCTHSVLKTSAGAFAGSSKWPKAGLGIPANGGHVQ